jgi:small-conductance mechanosensitive channel
MAFLENLYLEAFQPLFTGIFNAVPKVLAGAVFLALAYPAVKLVLWTVRSSLETSKRDPLIVDLGVSVASIFLWFGVSLAFLSVVGLEDIAASLGTATGFIGLGIAFALKGMIADTVAGVYLLKDDDFNPGDRVKTGDSEGVVQDIDLRKTRMELDSGDITVLSNQEVEKKWTKLEKE